MKMILRNFLLFFVQWLTIGIFFCSFALFAPQYASAREVVSKTYEDDLEKTSKRIHENFEQLVVPISKSLSYSLTKILPEVDGRRLPLGISIEPTDPVDPEGFVQVVYHCPWGRTICEPFFRACAALHEECAE